MLSFVEVHFCCSFPQPVEMRPRTFKQSRRGVEQPRRGFADVAADVARPRDVRVAGAAAGDEVEGRGAGVVVQVQGAHARQRPDRGRAGVERSSPTIPHIPSGKIHT